MGEPTYIGCWSPYRTLWR